MALTLIATFVLGGILLYIAGARMLHHRSPDSPLVSIAVLPFVNATANPEEEYFSDGWTEQLIDALANAEGLHVTARASAFQYKRRTAAVEEIGRQLDVGALVQGSIRKSGGRLFITAQLINTVNRHHLWSHTYDREMKDAVALQDEVAHAIVNALHIPLHTRANRPLVRQYTENPEAYDLYLKGLHYPPKAIKYFGEAVKLDPNYAPAFAMLASAYAALGYTGDAPADAVWSNAKAAAEKALSLDDSLAEAHSALGFAKAIHDWDWAGAEREFRRSIELNPSSAGAHGGYALVCLIPTARFVEAAVEAKKAMDLDPFQAAYRKALDMARNPHAADVWGDPGAEQDESRPIEMARRNALLGHRDDAFRWLQKALTARDPQLIWLKVDPRFDNIRQDARFPSYLKGMGL